ncbi:MAG: hydrolase [Burkholderiales bacterium]|nr:hydrolase [Burkholderiales bacterium]
MATTQTAYRAPPWLPGGNLQTLYPALLAPRPPVLYRRQRWDTPDGDFIDLDWTGNQDRGPEIESNRQPLLVLFHGLEGGSNSHYARALMHAACRRGWRGVVVHFRGCSGEINRLPRAYHSGDSAEIDWVLRRLRSRHTGLHAVGVSLGGNALLKWLGEQRGSAGDIVRRAAAVSAPVDLHAAADVLERGFNMNYTRNFLATMKRKSLAKLQCHPGLFDPARLRAARTLREFDDLITAPLHGYRDVNDYYTRASSKPWLACIAVPTLLLNARNDPFLPAVALPAPQELATAVSAVFPDEGGHVGFPDAGGTLDWLPRKVLEFFTGE